MITVEKAKRRLTLTRNGETLLSCGIALGFSPEGHKLEEGDGKTPEGKYRICSVNRESKFQIALGLSYPSGRDALNGLKQKRVHFFDFLAITLANLFHLRPKWDSPLGGYVMIHGQSPDGYEGDWTHGCIALSDEAIEKLASLCKRGEKVEIKP